MRNHYITRKIETSRLGFHYFADTDHYTNRDLNTWLPRLKELSAQWLILRADATRAIPENFIRGLLEARIKPVIHISLSLPNTPTAVDLRALLEAYARWGVKHIILFDRPNSSAAWAASGWSQQDLVERFIDRFLPLAVIIAQNGMTPLFPPLEPGGDYWDITFLKQSLRSLRRRGYSELVRQMMLASYAYTYNHELDWGTGGQKSWSKVRPYQITPDSQDQRGFNQYQWLAETSREVCEFDLPVILLGAGLKEPGVNYPPETHAELATSMIERLSGVPKTKEIPLYVKACCFFLLAAEPSSQEYESAWYKAGKDTLPIVPLLAKTSGLSDQKNVNHEPDENLFTSNNHPIAHYLLLPIYEWGVADYHLETIRPFIKKNHPTVGFSIDEAKLAQRVTVLGGESTFSEELLNNLRNSGCIVERISGDGTSIATQLAER